MKLLRLFGGWATDSADRIRASLKWRFAAVAVFWVCLITLLALLFFPNVLTEYKNFYLKEQARLILDHLVDDISITESGTVVVDYKVNDTLFRQPASGWYWQVETPDGEQKSASLEGQRLNPYQRRGPDNKEIPMQSRVVLMGEDNIPVRATVAISAHSTSDNIKLLTFSLSGILLLIMAGIIAITWLLIKWSLQPLNALKENLTRVHEGETPLLSGTYPVEVQPVVNDFNRVLQQHKELLERARNHTGNLAHALKTPLSILKNELVAMPAGQGEGLLEIFSQLHSRIHYHLSRARMVGSSNILAARSCPADVVDHVNVIFERAFEDKGVILVNELDDEIFVRVDQSDLEELLGNLIENGYKWARTLIRVYADISGNQYLLHIDDDGPSLPEQERESVFKRGVRLDELTHGTGLGLSIVAEIVGLYQGEITLAQSRSGGLSVRLVLPLTPDQDKS